jgi:Ribonuclease G/E
LGARSIARARRIDRASAGAFMDLGGGIEAVLALTDPAAGLAEGAVVEVEVTAEPRRGKSAVVRLIGPGEGPPRLSAAAPPLVEQLRGYAPGEDIAEGLEARLIADEAEAEALASEHPLPGGGSLAVEPTRALTAIDVDLGAGAGDARQAARRANLAAISAAARLLRLKALGGLVAIDLVGKGHDGEALSAAAKTAFAPDGPGVSIGPVNRFGLMILAKPWRHRPVRDILCGADGGASATTTGCRLLRALEREGWSDRGARLVGRCSPATAVAAHAYMGELSDRLGARFAIEPDPRLADDAFEIATA